MTTYYIGLDPNKWLELDPDIKEYIVDFLFDDYVAQDYMLTEDFSNESLFNASEKI